MISLSSARVLLSRIPPLMRARKTRYTIEVAGLVWEIDDPAQPVLLPDWIGREVTGDRRYGNSQLAQCPYALWAIAA